MPDATATAALTQILAGHAVAPDAECCQCRRPIRDGDRVTAYAYRREGKARWHVRGLSGPHCARERLQSPTQDFAEALVTATVSVGVLAPDDVIAWSGVQDGTAP